MPALPWVHREPVDPDREYVVMASRLPLTSYRHVPGFLRDTLRVRRQLAHADGLVAYALNAKLIRKTFWTFSVWTDQASLDTFAASEPHRNIIQHLGPRMGESRFNVSTVAGSGLPTDWNEMMAAVR
jgi:hypothetical protein